MLRCLDLERIWLLRLDVIANTDRTPPPTQSGKCLSIIGHVSLCRDVPQGLETFNFVVVGEVVDHRLTKVGLLY